MSPDPSPDSDPTADCRFDRPTDFDAARGSDFE